MAQSEKGYIVERPYALSQFHARAAHISPTDLRKLLSIDPLDRC
jgi:hypothetical protein